MSVVKSGVDLLIRMKEINIYLLGSYLILKKTKMRKMNSN